ncbi:hypothetical protein EA772_01480 [Pedobacter sp. G11]|uniref:hypothetical protein n=1 Tax=Pedobacter sp. G11 TaxID=2482728 RepID=UPI000F5DE02B|nr:hypothetical protein [Pedobacter sp. G11]AZI24077.1 hypothetical protein EA772_01480 [Pedobacter sp. G11]
MKQKFFVGLLLLAALGVSAQDQTINGSLSIGQDAGASLGNGDSLFFRGVQANSDELSIYRFNRAVNMSDLRVCIGDDYGEPGDRFVVGSHNWRDSKYYAHMVIDGDGKIGIGTEAMGAERLAVNGLVKAREVKVEGGVWPDYVFEKGYRPLSLLAVEKFISLNGHLPELPSASTVKANGIELGEMNRILLKKVEELTLHLIAQSKEIKALKRKVDKR